MKTVDKPIIILAAYGTTVPAGQRALEAIDSHVTEVHPDYTVYWAFTSDFIIRKLRNLGQTSLFERGVPLASLKELYAGLAAKGVRSVTVQSLHVSPGSEFHDLLAVPSDGIIVQYGRPLLADDTKMAEVLDVLSEKFGTADEVTILCGHGNDHFQKYNTAMIKLDTLVRATYKNTFLATVEGLPGAEKALADARATGLKKVCFVPVMITAGNHIMHDVLGDKKDSWESRLGMAARSIGGLGANPRICTLLINRLDAALLAST